MPDHYYHRKPQNNTRSLGGPFSPYPQSTFPSSSYPGAQPYGGELPGAGGPGFAGPFQGADGLAGGAELAPSSLAPGTELISAGGAGASAASAAATTTKAGGFSLANLTDLKGVIDRMGGIDGIVNSVGKVQKVVTGFQQLAPMFKLFTGLGKGKTNAAKSREVGEYRPKRKRRKSSASRKKGSTKRKKNSTVRPNTTSKRRR